MNDRYPAFAGTGFIQNLLYAGLAHLVERHLAKVEVASSSLVTRSIWRYSQAVRQGSATP